MKLEYNILQCPFTKEGLKLADNDIIIRANKRVRLESSFTEGLVNSSETIFYPYKKNILFFHQNYCVPLNDEIVVKQNLSFDKERIFNYYNEIKFIEFEGKRIYEDADKWIDFRSFILPYMQNSLSNVKKYIHSKGNYFADIACGSVAFKEYIQLAEGYDCRICIDLSVNALLEAQYNLAREKQNGIFICADMLSLPIKENTCDAVVCHHALFHVEKDLQLTALNEMYRIARPVGSVAIVYDWFYHSLLMNLTLGPVQIYRVARHYAGKVYATVFKKNKLYFYSHSRNWFIKNNPGTSIKFYTWRSINTYFSRLYLHQRLGGKRLLRYLWSLEESKPELMGRIGEYGVIVIKK